MPARTRDSAKSGLFFFGQHDFGKARFAKKARGFFRRRGIDVETSAPLEPGNLRQLRNYFNVPVVVVVDFLTYRRSVNHKIISGAVKHEVETHKRVFQHAREAGVNGALVV